MPKLSKTKIKQTCQDEHTRLKNLWASEETLALEYQLDQQTELDNVICQSIMLNNPIQVKEKYWGGITNPYKGVRVFAWHRDLKHDILEGAVAYPGTIAEIRHDGNILVNWNDGHEHGRLVTKDSVWLDTRDNRDRVSWLCRRGRNLWILSFTMPRASSTKSVRRL